MDSNPKRVHEDGSFLDDEAEQPQTKNIKIATEQDKPKLDGLTHGKGRPIPKQVLAKLTESDVKLLEEVKSSCTDIERLTAAIKLRMKHRLCIRLPEDMNDATYYMDRGLRRVYPYPYAHQVYAKRRWLGCKLKDIIKGEFRDITDEQLKLRFEKKLCLVNGNPVNIDYVVRDCDFMTNLVHRHELPVLATPIKIVYQDKDTMVINKPPSLPVHPCGRFRHNSIINVLRKEHGLSVVNVVHRLDRLVSGVLIIALNSSRAHFIEEAIKDREVQKEYVCRVVGKFPDGDPADDGWITVDEPLQEVRGKVAFSVVMEGGKPSLTKFKRLNFNGKTSAVLCRPKTGRMHQIRVHLQYLGHPITNDRFYNCDSFGPERGKGGKFGKSIKQIMEDILTTHRASTWLIADNTDLLDRNSDVEAPPAPTEVIYEGKTARFLSDEEREETMAALAGFFTDESYKVFEEKYKFDPDKLKPDPSCSDCIQDYHDPPMRNLFVYLHALSYSGKGWSYETEMPTWALDTWSY